MRTVHDSVETVNAAATAIVAAQARVQPSSVKKRRWGGWWSLYWCFGSYRHHKRIGPALLTSETTPQMPLTCYDENPNHTAATVGLPFIAPPSSPASHLTSDPALLPLSSLSVHACSSSDSTAHTFLIGPYAHDTQLVSPPVFSTFTTEPSTASFTPPPETVRLATPASPEVHFPQLLSSLLAQKWRNSGDNLKYPLSHYDFQPYNHIKSPVSSFSTPGTSSPFFDKCTHSELLRLVEAPKIVGYEHLMNWKWGSRVGSRLGSGALTPNGAEHPSQDISNLLENQIYQVVELGSSDTAHHRVSFELNDEDIPICIVKETILSSKFGSERIEEAAQGTKGEDLVTRVAHSFQAQATVEPANNEKN